jgi:hypothetical protein
MSTVLRDMRRDASHARAKVRAERAAHGINGNGSGNADDDDDELPAVSPTVSSASLTPSKKPSLASMRMKKAMDDTVPDIDPFDNDYDVPLQMNEDELTDELLQLEREMLDEKKKQGNNDDRKWGSRYDDWRSHRDSSSAATAAVKKPSIGRGGLSSARGGFKTGKSAVLSRSKPAVADLDDENEELNNNDYNNNGNGDGNNDDDDEDAWMTVKPSKRKAPKKGAATPTNDEELVEQITKEHSELFTKVLDLGFERLVCGLILSLFSLYHITD